MGTLTGGQPRLPGYCDHKLPTSCRLTSIPNCCACADERPHAASYPTYIDGIGYVLRGTRWDRYCWFCRQFWTNRMYFSGLRPAQTRIPENPDQTEFLERWYEFHRGYRLGKREDGSEFHIAVVGEDFREVDPGFLPRTLDELRDGRDPHEAMQNNEAQVAVPEEQQASGPTLDEALDQLYQDTLAEEAHDSAGPNTSISPAVAPRPQNASGTPFDTPQPRDETTSTNVQQSQTASATAVGITPQATPGPRGPEYQARRAAALRRELQRMRNGIERVISGLRELGEEIPDQSQSANGSLEASDIPHEGRDAVLRGLDTSTAQDVGTVGTRSLIPPSNQHLANLQTRVNQARAQLDDARRKRDEANVDFRTASQHFERLQREQRSTENYMQTFGTREQMAEQGENYISPIGSMFNRAEERFRAAEQARREERTLRRVLEDENRAGGEQLARVLAGLESQQRDVWSMPVRSSLANDIAAWALDSGVDQTRATDRSEQRAEGRSRRNRFTDRQIAGMLGSPERFTPGQMAGLEPFRPQPLIPMTAERSRQDRRVLSQFIHTALCEHLRPERRLSSPLSAEQIPVQARLFFENRFVEPDRLDELLGNKEFMWLLGVPQFETRRLRLLSANQQSELEGSVPWLRTIGLVTLAIQNSPDLFSLTNAPSNALVSLEEGAGIAQHLQTGMRTVEDFRRIWEFSIAFPSCLSIAEQSLKEFTAEEWLILDGRFLLEAFAESAELRRIFDIYDDVLHTSNDTLSLEEEGRVDTLPEPLLEQFEQWVNDRDIVWRSGLSAEWLKRRIRFVDRGGMGIFLPTPTRDSAGRRELDRASRVNPILKVELAKRAFINSPSIRLRGPHGLRTPAMLQMLYRLQRDEMSDADAVTLTVIYDADPEVVLKSVEALASPDELASVEQVSPHTNAQSNRASQPEAVIHHLEAPHAAILAGRRALQNARFRQAGSAATLEEDVLSLAMETPRQAANSAARASLYRPWSLSDFPRTEGDADGTDDEYSEDEDDKPKGLDALDSGRPEAKTEDEMRMLMDCKVCFTQVANVACVPCGHLAMCQWCSEQHSPTVRNDRTRPADPAARCPVCRKLIRNKYKVFRP